MAADGRMQDFESIVGCQPGQAGIDIAEIDEYFDQLRELIEIYHAQKTEAARHHMRYFLELLVNRRLWLQLVLAFSAILMLLLVLYAAPLSKDLDLGLGIAIGIDLFLLAGLLIIGR